VREKRAVATRVDVRGFREEVGYLDSSRDRIASSSYLPHAPPLGGLVICPPICADGLRNYRAEVVAARTLAGVGIAVQRFQYRGTGNSDGKSEAITFAAMTEDAVAAARHLAARSSAHPLAYMGTRLGALVAAAAAEPRCALVLIDPILEGRQFFREGFRARMAHAVKELESSPLTSKQLLAELAETGAMDILGETIGRGLYDSTVDRVLLDQMGNDVGPVLLLQLGTGPLRRDVDELAEALRERGTVVDVATVGREQAWWFVGSEPVPADAVAAAVAEWLPSALSAPVADRGADGRQ
jgi:hypothetical protein